MIKVQCECFSRQNVPSAWSDLRQQRPFDTNSSRHHYQQTRYLSFYITLEFRRFYIKGVIKALETIAAGLRGWTKTLSREKKILDGNGDAGTRAAPTKSGKNDAKIGGRLDFGEIVTKDGKQYRRYNMQANLDADNHTIRGCRPERSPQKVVARGHANQGSCQGHIRRAKAGEVLI